MIANLRCYFTSSQNDVQEFLRQMNLNPEHYQVGHQKIFLRESEKAKLDYRLHQAILASIVTIQRWFRSCIERRNFLSIRSAVVRIQVPLKIYSIIIQLITCIFIPSSAFKEWLKLFIVMTTYRNWLFLPILFVYQLFAINFLLFLKSLPVIWIYKTKLNPDNLLFHFIAFHYNLF